MSENNAVQVIIPTPLRQYTKNQARISGQGATVAQLFDDLEQNYPGLKDRICDPDGQIRRFVNVFINGENVRDHDGIDTPVKAGDEIGIIPAMAGGRV